MDVQNDERVEPMRSVIGVIRGREEPDKLVILGNHHDAWIYGAVDPSSGTAAILEVARALGEAVKKGLPAAAHDRLHGLGRRGSAARRLDAVGARQRRQPAQATP